MHADTTSVMTRLYSSDQIQSLLEIGSGPHSTPLFRKIAKAKQKGFIVSLEDSEMWQNKVRKIVPDDEYGRVLLSKFLYDAESEAFRYEYPLVGRYDLILIDGPGVLQGRNRKTMKGLLSRSSCPIGMSMDNGSQSIHLLDYALPAMHDESIVVLDGRVGTMLFLLHKWGGKLNFCWYGERYKKSIIRGQLKSSYRELSNYPLSKVTVVTKNGASRWRDILGAPNS